MRRLQISLWFTLVMFAATAAFGRTLYLSREMVTDQFGNQLDFSRDAVGNRIVIIGLPTDFIYEFVPKRMHRGNHAW